MLFSLPACLLPHHLNAQTTQDFTDDAALLLRS
jgi:hypothetical protein